MIFPEKLVYQTRVYEKQGVSNSRRRRRRWGGKIAPQGKIFENGARSFKNRLKFLRSYPNFQKFFPAGLFIILFSICKLIIYISKM